jgi:predicted transcriptional regulator
MTVVSTKEFSSNQEKYFDMAVNGQVCIQRGKNMFYLSYAPIEPKYPEQPILEPDEIFRSAITMGEFRKRAAETVKKVHDRYTDECKNIATGT